MQASAAGNPFVTLSLVGRQSYAIAPNALSGVELPQGKHWQSSTVLDWVRRVWTEGTRRQRKVPKLTFRSC